LKPNLGAASSAELVKHLSNPNGWHRQTAHRLLLERLDRSVIADLKTVAASGPSAESRTHALWLLHAYSALEPNEVERAMKDSDARVRENALQLSDFFLKDSKPLADEVLALAADSDPHVRFQAALSIGEWKDRRLIPTLSGIAHRDSSDPWFRIAILSSVGDAASEFFHVVLAKGESWTDASLSVDAVASLVAVFAR
jgi:HEAT repeat protein